MLWHCIIWENTQIVKFRIFFSRVTFYTLFCKYMLHTISSTQPSKSNLQKENKWVWSKSFIYVYKVDSIYYKQIIDKLVVSTLTPKNCQVELLSFIYDVLVSTFSFINDNLSFKMIFLLSQLYLQNWKITFMTTQSNRQIKLW